MERERPPTDSRRTVTRRRLLIAAGGVTTLGTTALAVAPDRTRADVTMGEFSVAGDSATLDSPPEAITIDASGEYQIDAPSPPEKVELTMQVRVDGQESDDLARDAAFGTASGTFDFSADLYSHRAVERGDLVPDAAGETAETQLRVRIIVGAVQDGELVVEEFVEETATLSLTQDSMSVAIGGSATVSIEP